MTQVVEAFSRLRDDKYKDRGGFDPNYILIEGGSYEKL